MNYITVNDLLTFSLLIVAIITLVVNVTQHNKKK